MEYGVFAEDSNTHPSPLSTLWSILKSKTSKSPEKTPWTRLLGKPFGSDYEMNTSRVGVRKQIEWLVPALIPTLARTTATFTITPKDCVRVPSWQRGPFKSTICGGKNHRKFMTTKKGSRGHSKATTLVTSTYPPSFMKPWAPVAACNAS